MAEQPLVLRQGYEILSVQPADPPAGTQGADWHLYVIGQGSNRIEGHRQGKIKVVTKAVEEIVAQLNERRLGKRGRVNLVPTPKKTSQK